MSEEETKNQLIKEKSNVRITVNPNLNAKRGTEEYLNPRETVRSRNPQARWQRNSNVCLMQSSSETRRHARKLGGRPQQASPVHGTGAPADLQHRIVIVKGHSSTANIQGLFTPSNRLVFLFLQSLDLPLYLCGCPFHICSAVKSATDHQDGHCQKEEQHCGHYGLVVGCVDLNQTRVDVEGEVVGANRLQLLPISVGHATTGVEFNQNIQLLGCSCPHYSALHFRWVLLNYEKSHESGANSDRVVVSKIWKRRDWMNELHSKGA